MRRSLALLVALAVVGCTEAERPVVTSAGAETGEQERPDPGWHRLPASPLSPRQNANAFWTGSEVLIFGGRTADSCFIEGHCAPLDPPPLRDGASFDPASGEWRTIARAPVPLGWVVGAVLGDTLYLFVPGYEAGQRARPAFLAYAIGEDRWKELPLPPERWPSSLVATDDHLIGVLESHEGGRAPDAVFDPATEAWSELPRDPFGRMYDRSMVWTGEELILTGIELTGEPPPGEPSRYRAAAFDPSTGRWRTPPAPEMAGGYPIWFWAGGRVVNPSTGYADGGEADPYDRPHPYSGVLDPIASAWEPLPNPPGGYGPYRDLVVGGDETVVSSWGWVLHVPSGTWERLTRPFKDLYRNEAAVWAGDRLIVWGGVRWRKGKEKVLNEGWAWVPETA